MARISLPAFRPKKKRASSPHRFPAHGNRNTMPVTVAACTANPRALIGTAGQVQGAQLPGR
jgi:hypothetical protein